MVRPLGDFVQVLYDSAIADVGQSRASPTPIDQALASPSLVCLAEAAMAEATRPTPRAHRRYAKLHLVEAACRQESDHRSARGYGGRSLAFKRGKPAQCTYAITADDAGKLTFVLVQM